MTQQTQDIIFTLKDILYWLFPSLKQWAEQRRIEMMRQNAGHFIEIAGDRASASSLDNVELTPEDEAWLDEWDELKLVPLIDNNDQPVTHKTISSASNMVIVRDIPRDVSEEYVLEDFDE